MRNSTLKNFYGIGSWVKMDELLLSKTWSLNFSHPFMSKCSLGWMIVSFSMLKKSPVCILIVVASLTSCRNSCHNRQVQFNMTSAWAIQHHFHPSLSFPKTFPKESNHGVLSIRYIFTTSSYAALLYLQQMALLGFFPTTFCRSWDTSSCQQSCTVTWDLLKDALPTELLRRSKYSLLYYIEHFDLYGTNNLVHLIL